MQEGRNAMNIIINCRQMDLTKNLREYAESKISRFSKYLNNVSEATVTLSVEKYRHKAEVHLKANGSLIQAESITGEMYSSIDDVVEKLARQVARNARVSRKENPGIEKAKKNFGKTFIEKLLKMREIKAPPKDEREGIDAGKL